MVWTGVPSTAPDRNPACACRDETAEHLKWESCDARFDDVVFHRCFFRPGVSLRQGVPEVEVAMDLITAVALILSILLLGYLTVSLLYPEKF